MRISSLNQALSTTQKQLKHSPASSLLTLLLVIALATAGINICAQQKPSAKITPKTTKKTVKPAVKPKTVTPVTVKPITKTPVTVKKITTTPKPAVAKPATPAIAPGDIVSDVILIVDGKVMNAGAIELIRGQQVMIWLRDLERLGWGVISSDAGGKVSLASKNVKLTFTKNQDTAMVNSLAVKLPISTYMRDEKLMVPLSFVSKSMGHEYDSSYRPVAFIVTDITPQNNTAKPQPKVAIGNTLQGMVVFNGRPIPGVKIRTVDKDLMEIEGTRTVTNADGAFTIANLPDGEYAAYVYTGDNPDYFNRATEVAAVNGNQVYNLKPLSLGRILSGVFPVSEEPAKAENGEINASWTALDGVAEYRLNIKTVDGTEVEPQLRTKEAKIAFKTDKLTPGTKYVLEVTAYDANGEFLGGTPGAGGKPWTFIYTDK